LPTETVYGLGANALDSGAVGRIFEAKQRPAWDPIIVHIAEAEMLGQLVADVPEKARQLMEAFWPGPLTLLLPRSTAVPDAVTAGRPLVGVRMPSHQVALELIRRAGISIAAPSANRFAHISPTTAAHVLHDLTGRIDAVLDAGPTARGVESTVLDPSTTPMTIYRPGAVTEEQIRAVAGAVAVFKEPGKAGEESREALPSPGVGIRHYAPRARLVLITVPEQQLGAQLAESARNRPDEVLGVMLPEGVPAPPGVDAARLFAWGRWDAPEELAQRLYAGLRALDAGGCSVILCPLPPPDGIGAAIRDRLEKAAR
jgi:L-threonylcarbamoyladenylate synthase